MLYVTTRNNSDPYTAYRAMHELRGPDGGFFLPFRHPKFSEEELDALAQKPFGQRIADVLNRLFNTRLTGWDVDFCCGRAPVRLTPLRHKILITEAWHTTSGTFHHMIKALATRLTGNDESVSDWMEIAIRAAVFFGIFGELKHYGIEQVDISVVSGDFTLPVSAWYARRWGLPIGRILCCCNENNAVWELFCHGQMRTDAISIPTIVPEADVALPVGLERLIYESGGICETQRYLDCCRHGKNYYSGDSVMSKLRSGMYVSVVSSHRLESTIPSVYRTHGYLLTPCLALAYAGLLDYRAKTGEIGPILVWGEDSPALHTQTISRFTGIPEKEIRDNY